MRNEDTEALLRSRIKALLSLGVSQRALADRLNVSESWLSRWVAGDDAKQKARPINVREMDRFQQYLRDLRNVIEETQRATVKPNGDATAGKEFPPRTSAGAAPDKPRASRRKSGH